ncbi:hypothetical protein LOD99_1004 [Oopsacas minuta]|uniref:Major facilitator superfamily (MFS) profile domain-containing protein n=1 Tax=Oopsacas minuta TaxID=111878 RepID=A0AAV7K0Y1_9METZ|nr:hypothetical protein LOD99_1004 [Oopsacas minuta]
MSTNSNHTPLKRNDSDPDSSLNDSDNTPLLSYIKSNAKSNYTGAESEGKTLSFGTDSVMFRSWNLNTVPASVSKRWIGGPDQRRWWSIRIMYFTMFLSSMSFSIIVSNIWPYLITMDKHASTSLYGWIVAAFSFGQLVGSPILGFWANYRPVREPMFVSLIIFTLFSFLYSYCDAFSPEIAPWVMLVCRFLIGVGAGNVSVVRSYIAAATTVRERTSAMANVSAFQALGIILGPVFGIAFSPLHYPGLTIPAIKFQFNIYTGPGYLGGFLGIINLLLLLCYKEIRLFNKRGESINPTVNGSSNRVLTLQDSSKKSSPPGYDKIGAFVCIFLFFSIFAVFTVFETLCTPLSMDEFAWTGQQATVYNNIVYLVLGMVAISVFIIIKILSRHIQERTLFVFGLMVLSIALFIFIPLPGEPPVVKYEPIYPNGTYIKPNGTEAVGCDFIKHNWCEDVPRLELWQFIIGALFMGIGFPITQVMSYSMFSKLLGPFPQGLMMGFLTAAGSLARSIGPIFVSYVYMHTGPQITFAILDGYIGIVIILSVIFYKRLVPYKYTHILTSEA